MNQGRGPFYGALDRFSQFFVEPLFLSSTLDRELQAVDSENKKNLQSDNWRLTQLHKTLSNPRHPYHHFSTGNLQTLRDEPTKRGLEIRSEFIKFYQKHYSANRMKLVALGKESLDELEQWVVELFSSVKNQDLSQNRWDDIPLFSEESTSTQIFAKPVMESRSLDLQFPYQDEDEQYMEQPAHYISHLLGHEGPGSVLAYIKAKGWANSLSAGSYTVCPGSAFFTISMRLTPDGLDNYNEIVKTIFQYISLIKETPPQKWIFDEMKILGDVNFNFMEKSRASSFTRKTSSIMQKPYPRNWLLSGQHKLRQFDARAISNAMEYLRPDNFRMVIVSQDYPGDWDKKEKWYGTEYKIEKIPDTILTNLHKALATSPPDRIPDLHLPHKNEFVPTRLDVEKVEVPEPAKAPKLIKNDDYGRLWWKKDDQFWVPKANVNFIFKSPLVNASTSNLVKTKLFCELVTDALSEYSYDAELAGLDYALAASRAGIEISIGGYNDKMAVLLEKVLITMRDLQVKSDRFKITKERMSRSYKNWNFQPAYQQVGEFTRFLNSDKAFMMEEYAQALPTIEAEDVQIFFPQILTSFYLEVLVHGNLNKGDAVRLTGLVESTLGYRPLTKSDIPQKRSIIHPGGTDYTFKHTLADPGNVNNALEYYLYICLTTDRETRARLQMFSQMTDEPAFDQLRTKEQLGYIVWSGPRLAATTLGYRVIIQSDRPIEHLEERITAFLLKFGEDLEKMSSDDFENHRRSLINKRLEKLKSLDQESGRFFSHVASEFYDFEQVDLDVAHLRKLSKQDIIEFYKTYIDPRSPARAKLSIQMHAKSKASDTSKNLSPEQQKQQLLDAIQQFLEALEVPVDVAKLVERFNSVELVKGSESNILATVEGYLKDESGTPQAEIDGIMEQGQVILGEFLVRIGVKAPPSTEQLPDGVELVKRDSILITDPHAWKATLPITQAAKPVTDLSQYEEIDAKL